VLSRVRGGRGLTGRARGRRPRRRARPSGRLPLRGAGATTGRVRAPRKSRGRQHLGCPLDDIGGKAGRTGRDEVGQQFDRENPGSVDLECPVASAVACHGNDRHGRARPRRDERSGYARHLPGKIGECAGLRVRAGSHRPWPTSPRALGEADPPRRALTLPPHPPRRHRPFRTVGSVRSDMERRCHQIGVPVEM
jgi:hypothetical protein